MPKVAFDAFSRQLKQGQVPPAVYLYGDEDALKEEAVKAIQDAVVDPGLRDFNFDVRSAASLEPEAVETLCTTLPMMADRRLVVIRDVESWNKRARARAAVLHYLQHPSPETVLILVEAAPAPDDRGEPDADLVRHTSAVEVAGVSPRVAEKWLARRAEERGVSLDAEAARHLLQAVGGSLGAARTELDKLAGLGGGAPLTVEQVSGIIGVRHGETAADWLDAVLGDAPGRAAAMLPHLLDQRGVSAVPLLNQLGTQLIGLGLARALYDRGQRGGALEAGIVQALIRARPAGRPDYRGSAARWSAVVAQWPRRRIDAAIAAALGADQRLKGTSLGDERGILTDLVMQLAWKGRAAA